MAKKNWKSEEICGKCRHWSETYRSHHDAGTMAMCEKLSGEGFHPAYENVMVYTGGDPAKYQIVDTRWNFSCSEFEVKE